MLTAMRGATGGIVAKTFLVLLAGSFAVWGVADVFNGNSDKVLAKVGEREISAVEFRSFFDQRLQNLSRRTGQPLTTAQARQIGLDRQILGDLLRAGALDEQAKTMKMSLSDKFVAEQIAKNPVFQDASGNFSPGALQQRLYNSNVSEQQFVVNERNNMIRQAFTDAISEGLGAPKTLVKLVAEQAAEKRDVSYFVLSGDAIEISEPTDKETSEFYDKNKSRFAIAERRVFETMSINSATLGKNAEITEDGLKKLYEQQKSRFGTVETRVIEQIPFGNTQEAAVALKKIKEGAAFGSIAKERGLTEKDRLLGTFSKPDVPDVQIAEAAFKLKEGDVSEPITGKLSTFLIKVTKINPENIKALSEVRDELVKIIQTEAGRDEILALRDKVEDERGGGSSFKEIARNLGLSFKMTAPVSRAGFDKDGNAVTGITDWAKVLQAGNESDTGLEIDPIATADDGFVWINVQEIIKSHTQPLKDANDKAVKLWKAEQRRQALKKKAEGLAKRINGGEKFDEAAKASNSEIQKVLGIDRRTASTDFDGNAVRAAFVTPVDKTTYTVDPDGKTAKVMTTTPVLLPPYDPTAKNVKEVENQLSQLVSNDVFAGYMAELQKTVGVEIKQDAWSRVFQTQSNY